EYFVSATVTMAARDVLLRTTAKRDVEVLAYCFMPDHLHALLASEADGGDFKACIATFRQVSGYYFRRSCGDRLGEEGYFDRHVRERDDTWAVISYIVGNPVRKGLCAVPADYPWSGSSRYALDDLAEAVQWRPDTLG